MVYTFEKINSYSKIIGIGKKIFKKLSINEKPVIIYKNAFNENEPFEDIYFSKKHLILVKNKLEHCIDIINNTTIFENSLLLNIEYYHIQLEEYCLINVNGILAETYCNEGNIIDNLFDLWLN
jgi:hypothetical protein